VEAADAAGGGGRPVLLAQLPEPARLWVRYAPRRTGAPPWPAPAVPWTDLAGGRIAGLGSPPETGGALPALADELLDDVLYLPPVAPEHRPERDRTAAAQAARGTPVLVQVPVLGPVGGAAEAPPPRVEETVEGMTAVFDPLPAILAGDTGALAALPPGAVVAWPVIPGVSDGEEAFAAAADRLAAAGAAVLQSVAVELSPQDRRALLELLGEHLFAPLFHGAPPPLAVFARAAARRGLQPFLPRPLPRAPLGGAANRRVAGLLALAGELADRLGDAPTLAQELFRAARETDRLPYDLAALAREGNLGLLPWLTAPTRALVEEALTGGCPVLLAELRGRYLAERSAEGPPDR
jgi:hypothetical protein